MSLYEELIARFGDSADPKVQKRVATALLEKGLALHELDRHEDELRAYDELLDRYADIEDPELLEHVAWALYDKAVTLEKLDREGHAATTYGEIVERFRNSDDPEIRPRVSWSLWALNKLRQHDEGEACRELVERGDDELDPELRDHVLAAYQTLARRANESGQPLEALQKVDALLERAAEATDATEQVRVNNALVWKAHLLVRLSRYDEAIAIYDEVIPRLDQSEHREPAIDARRRRAIACDKVGRPDEALRGYDDTLSLLVDATESSLRSQAVEVLTSKGLTLRALARRDETLVVLGNVIAAYRKLEAQGAAGVRATVVRAVMEKLQLLCELGRSDEAADVECELVELLGDVSPPAPAPLSANPVDAELAALLARLHRSDCWTVFEAPPDEAAMQFEAQALELYGQTDPFLAAPVNSWDAPELIAATVIRQIADGFALLSQPRAASQLALPNRRLLEWAMRRFGLDEWSAEHGYPLSLDDSSEDIQDVLDEQPEPESDLADGCAAACVAALYQRGLLATLCDSPTGRDALRSSTHRWLAVRHLNAARSWGAWAFAHVDDAQPATAAGILVAQAYYRTTRETVASTALTPTVETLRDLLHNSDGIEWLTNRDFVLPAGLD